MRLMEWNLHIAEDVASVVSEIEFRLTIRFFGFVEKHEIMRAARMAHANE